MWHNYTLNSLCWPRGLPIVMSPQESYRIAIQKEGMIKDLVKNLSSDNDELQMHCASAIFKVPVFHTPAIVYERNEQNWKKKHKK